MILMWSFPEPIISPAWSSRKKPACKTRLQSLNAISDKVHHQTQTGLCSWARPHTSSNATVYSEIPQNAKWQTFHFIIWYISSHGAVVTGNKQGCCMTHGKALRIALQLNARITGCHCRGVHIPQVSHKWLSLNIKISKVFYQPPPAPLSTNDCVHLGNVDVFPFCRNHPGHWHHHSSCVSEAFSKADIWTTTRRRTVKSIHVCTMTQSSSLSIFFHPWSNSGSLCAFPSYPGLRVETRLWAI